jgi:hypothetical protein
MKSRGVLFGYMRAHLKLKYFNLKSADDSVPSDVLHDRRSAFEYLSSVICHFLDSGPRTSAA